MAAVVLFDAILTGWVSKHNSVGLIPVQRRCSDAVAAQRWSIPKCSLHFGIVRRCSCVKVGLPDFLQQKMHKIIFPLRNTVLLNQTVGMASKSTTAANYVYDTLVMVSLGAWKMTFAGNTVYPCGSIDTNFDLP